jgi:hypothetical protein
VLLDGIARVLRAKIRSRRGAFTIEEAARVARYRPTSRLIELKDEREFQPMQH